MLKTRLLLIAICAISIWLLFMLPKVVIENEGRLTGATGNAADSVTSSMPEHVRASPETRQLIDRVKKELGRSTEKEKNAIFADSLAALYRTANQFDSAGWYAERASEFFDTPESWIKAADIYYQAFTLAINKETQHKFASKAQELYSKVLEGNPGNLEAKTKLAMTYISSANPMQGIMMLRDVLEKDPQNELALFNMGMLSIQSGQYDRAVERLQKLVEINPRHVQGQLLLGVAFMNSGDKEKARTQFEKVKQLDQDPAVQATVDSYLEDLK